MWALTSVVAVALWGASSPSPGKTPDLVVRGFYTAYREVHPPGGLPDADQLSRLSPFLSTRLQRLIVAALRYDAEFARRHPDEKPPFVDGDFFSSNFEGSTAFEVGTTEKQGAAYRVSVEFEYVDPSRPGDPFRWKDAVILVQEHGRLLIDDVEFLGDWPFGNHGLLSTILRSRN
jgi:hypothetical protein